MYLVARLSDSAVSEFSFKNAFWTSITSNAGFIRLFFESPIKKTGFRRDQLFGFAVAAVIGYE